ncbi:tetratricopeptide repeat protein [Leptodesmis sp.]|uniref:tetratricopeptide repeat protein n=1 Tax=Leptodesmis sp. TaxID=3100501 RepID=UPI0040534885
MNPNEQAYEALKRWQKALSLTDSDTQLILPSPGQENQSPANPKDLEFYKKQYQEAMERGYPLSDRDRQELESLRQVLHLRDEDVLTIEQQLARTVLQTNETTVEPPRLVTDAASPHSPVPADTHPASRSADAEVGTPEATNAMPQNAASSPGNSSLEQVLSQLPSNVQAVVKQMLKKEETGIPGAAASGERGQQLAAHPGESGVSGAASSEPMGQQPVSEPAANTEFASSEVISPSQPDFQAEMAANNPAEQPPAEEPRTRARVKVDRRPWLISIILLGMTLGILAGAWLAARTYLVPPVKDPEAADRFFQSGTQQAKQGRNSQAIADLTQAIQLNPNDPNLYLNRGVTHYQEGNLTAALEDYNKALNLNPNFAEALSNRSQVYVAQQRYDEAINDASRAIQLNPNLTEAYLNRGNAYFGKNNLDGATQDYQKVLQLKPDPANQSKAYNNLGNINAAQNQLDTAITNYDQAILMVRGYADAFFNRALALARKDQCADAIQGFRDAANLYQNQGNSEMQRRAERNVQRLQKCTPAPGSSPQPNSTSSV